MLAKGTKLESYTYRLDGLSRVFFIRGKSRSMVFRRLFMLFSYDWDRRIEVFNYPSGVSVYDGPVSGLVY